MPVTKQAKKRLRTDAKKRDLNLATLSKLKSLKKKFRALTALDDAQKCYQTLSREFDKAVSRGIIPKNRANRIKSRAALHVATLKNTSK